MPFANGGVEVPFIAAAHRVDEVFKVADGPLEPLEFLALFVKSNGLAVIGHQHVAAFAFDDVADLSVFVGVHILGAGLFRQTADFHDQGGGKVIVKRNEGIGCLGVILVAEAPADGQDAGGQDFLAQEPARHIHFVDALVAQTEPRLALGPVLASQASAAMDISDGLALDLSRMCQASQVSAEVSAGAIPLSQAARAIAANNADAMKTILTGGDDYEILAAVPPERARAFEAASLAAGVPVARIGAVIAGAGAPRFKAADGSELNFAVKGFEHFKV